MKEKEDRVFHFDDEDILRYSASESDSMEYTTFDDEHTLSAFEFDGDDQIDFDSQIIRDDIPCDFDSKQLELRHLSMSSVTVFSIFCIV